MVMFILLAFALLIGQISGQYDYYNGYPSYSGYAFAASAPQRSPHPSKQTYRWVWAAMPHALNAHIPILSTSNISHQIKTSRHVVLLASVNAFVFAGRLLVLDNWEVGAPDACLMIAETGVPKPDLWVSPYLLFYPIDSFGWFISGSIHDTFACSW